MDGEAVTTTLSTIITSVGSLTTATNTMFTTLSTHWFVFLPITFTLFGFLFGKFKSILMFRKGRRGRR